MSDSTPASAAPYLLVAAALRERIADGTWPAGTRLPSRYTLSKELGHGAAVVRRAMTLLISEGLLEGRTGSGTYVRSPHTRQALLRTPVAGQPGRSAIAPLGFTGTWESDTVAKIEASEEIAARLAITPGDLCVRTTYEFLSDYRPVMAATSWEPMAVTGGSVIVLPEGGPLAGHGVIARMRHIGIHVETVTEVPRPVQVDYDQAQLLGVATGSLATLIERTHLDADGRPVESADILVPADRWDVTYRLATDEPNRGA